MQQALVNHAWVSDILGGLPVGVLIDYLRLWDILANIQLQPGIEDKHIWRFSSSGQYSAKTAYEGFFLGSTIFSSWEKKYGRLGLLVNALSSCGLLPMNDAGLLIALSAVPYLILKAVLCVIRHQSRLTISLWAVPLQGNSGFISFHKLACEPSPPSFLIHYSLIGGKGPVMI